MSEPLKFQATTSLVTGAGSGIGRAIAHELARQGLAVGVNDIDRDAAQAICTEIVATSGRAIAVAGDVSIAAEVAAMVTQITETWSTLDVLVNNAGFGQYAPFEEITEAQCDQMIAVHLKGAFNCVQAVLPGMKRSGFGRIVLMSSVAGMTRDAVPRALLYGQGWIDWSDQGARERARTRWHYGKCIGARHDRDAIFERDDRRAQTNVSNPNAARASGNT